jgi:4-amino-4-deoxy-L-arabinose transferase-like glycosyltransferase
VPSFRENSRSAVDWLELQERKLFARDSKQIAKVTIFLITVIFLALVLISTVYLNPFGKNQNSDEYIYTSSAQYILTGHVCSPYTFWSLPAQKLCNLEHPPLVKEVMAVSMLFLGNNMWGARLPSIIFGTLCIPLVAYISWRVVRSAKVAVIAAALMAFNPLLIGLSSIALLDTGEIFFALCAIALYLSGLFRSHTIWKLLTVGSLFGLSILSKEVGVFVLLALITYAFFELKLVTAIRRSVCILAGSALTVAAGFQFYDHYFTTFPNFVAGIEFLYNFARSVHGYYVSTNPELWLTSFTNRDLGSGLGVLNPVITFPVFVWIPLLAMYVITRRSAHALTLPAVLLFWTYFPYFVLLDYFHRDVKYFYSIQMTPALVLGAAFLYSAMGDNLLKWKNNNSRNLVITLTVCIVTFAILLNYLVLAPSIVSSTSQYSPPVTTPPYGIYRFENTSMPSIDLPLSSSSWVSPITSIRR